VVRNWSGVFPLSQPWLLYIKVLLRQLLGMQNGISAGESLFVASAWLRGGRVE
jgi:hypothetical protein